MVVVLNVGSTVEQLVNKIVKSVNGSPRQVGVLGLGVNLKGVNQVVDRALSEHLDSVFLVFCSPLV